MPDSAALPAAVAAFDAVADRFDERFGDWRSVAAQRRAVRRNLLAVFPAGSHLLELAGGTAEDALFLAGHGRRVTLTDGAPSMVARARAKVAAAGMSQHITVAQLLLEDVDALANDARFDGVYSNFAGLNCTSDLTAVARGLSRMLPCGAAAVFVVFGPCAPGEVFVQLVRGDARAAFRRLRRAHVHAQVAGRSFQVHYASPARIAAAFRPWFRLRAARGIGVFVPPSAAEPWISRFPRMVRVLESLDRVVARPFAWLGDHVLLHLERTAAA